MEPPPDMSSRPMYHEWPCGQWRQVAAATLGTSNRIRNVAAMIHRHATFRIQPVRLNGITRQRTRRGGNLPPATFRMQPVRLNGTTLRHVIPRERKRVEESSQVADFILWWFLPQRGGFLHSADATVGMTSVFAVVVTSSNEQRVALRPMAADCRRYMA